MEMKNTPSFSNDLNGFGDTPTQHISETPEFIKKDISQVKKYANSVTFIFMLLLIGASVSYGIYFNQLQRSAQESVAESQPTFVGQSSSPVAEEHTDKGAMEPTQKEINETSETTLSDELFAQSNAEGYDKNIQTWQVQKGKKYSFEFLSPAFFSRSDYVNAAYESFSLKNEKLPTVDLLEKVDFSVTHGYLPTGYYEKATIGPHRISYKSFDEANSLVVFIEESGVLLFKFEFFGTTDLDNVYVQNMVSSFTVNVENSEFKEYYVDSEYGYQISYPSFWEFRKTYGQDAVKQAPTDILSGIDLHYPALKAQAATIVVTVFDAKGETTPQQWIQTYEKSVSNGEKSISMLKGHETVEYLFLDVNTSMQVRTIYFISGQFLYKITMKQANEIGALTQSVVDTFQP